MRVTRQLCLTSALLLLPILVAAQTASTQPSRQRTATTETRDNVENKTRDGSRAENARELQADAASPGKSEDAKGKKGEAPGQAKKSKDSKDKSKDKK